MTHGLEYARAVNRLSSVTRKLLLRQLDAISKDG